MTAEITLGRDKPYLLKGKLDMYGATTRQWKVPKSAPLGKGTIKVTVVDHNTPYSTSIQFEVVK